jgi:hypothetical protein
MNIFCFSSRSLACIIASWSGLGIQSYVSEYICFWQSTYVGSTFLKRFLFQNVCSWIQTISVTIPAAGFVAGSRTVPISSLAPEILIPNHIYSDICQSLQCTLIIPTLCQAHNFLDVGVTSQFMKQPARWPVFLLFQSRKPGTESYEYGWDRFATVEIPECTITLVRLRT